MGLGLIIKRICAAVCVGLGGGHRLRRIHLDPSESHTTSSLADVCLSDGMRVGRKRKGFLGRYERVVCLVDIAGPFLGGWKHREDVHLSRVLEGRNRMLICRRSGDARSPMLDVYSA